MEIKEIFINEVEKVIEEALVNHKRNILFVSFLCEYERVQDCLYKHREYQIIHTQPSVIWDENEFGILEKVKRNGEEICGIPTNTLEKMNSKKAILFMNVFGNKCIKDFDGVMNIVKYRYYMNPAPNDNYEKKVRMDVSELGMFVAVTSDDEKGFYLSEDNYQFFDEVYKFAFSTQIFREEFISGYDRKIQSLENKKDAADPRLVACYLAQLKAERNLGVFILDDPRFSFDYERMTSFSGKMGFLPYEFGSVVEDLIRGDNLEFRGISDKAKKMLLEITADYKKTNKR